MTRILRRSTYFWPRLRQFDSITKQVLSTRWLIALALMVPMGCQSMSGGGKGPALAPILPDGPPSHTEASRHEVRLSQLAQLRPLHRQRSNDLPTPPPARPSVEEPEIRLVNRELPASLIRRVQLQPPTSKLESDDQPNRRAIWLGRSSTLRPIAAIRGDDGVPVRLESEVVETPIEMVGDEYPLPPDPLAPNAFAVPMTAPMPFETVQASPATDQGPVWTDPFTGPGVSADQPGLADNISARGGLSYFTNDNSTSIGMTGILETTHQLGDLPWFAFAGSGVSYFDGEWPWVFTLGLSKLAVIEGDEVVNPWIVAVSYDGYADSRFFGTEDIVYIDQIRMMMGLALNPHLDVGVWSAIGLRSDEGQIPVAGGRFVVPARFADRVAAYASIDTGFHDAHLIYSAGWQEGQGVDFFTEADLWVPFTESTNAYVQVGYDGTGSWDATVGLEFKLPAKHRRVARRDRQCCAAACCDPCAEACCDACCRPTRRYRGGWANDTYRGALRLPDPARFRRYLRNSAPVFQPATTTMTTSASTSSAQAPASPPVSSADNSGSTPPIVVEPVTDNDPMGPVINLPEDPTGSGTTVDTPIPRWFQRPMRESNLSRLLETTSQ